MSLALSSRLNQSVFSSKTRLTFTRQQQAYQQTLVALVDLGLEAPFSDDEVHDRLFLAIAAWVNDSPWESQPYDYNRCELVYHVDNPFLEKELSCKGLQLSHVMIIETSTVARSTPLGAPWRHKGQYYLVA